MKAVGQRPLDSKLLPRANTETSWGGGDCWGDTFSLAAAYGGQFSLAEPYQRAGTHSHWLQESRDGYIGSGLCENSLWNEWNASKNVSFKMVSQSFLQGAVGPSRKGDQDGMYLFPLVLTLSQWSDGRW